MDLYVTSKIGSSLALAKPMMNLEDVISAFVSIIEDIIQDRKARLGRNAHLDENDCVVTR